MDEPLEIMGTQEVAKRLGVSTQRVHQLAHTYEDFPIPATKLATGNVWRTRDVEAWIAAHPDRPTGRRRSRGR